MRDTDDTLLPVRLPNHVGDACMALPALHLLAASGFAPLLVGQAWAASLFEGHPWPVLSLQRGLLRSARTVAQRVGRPRHAAVVLPNSFSSALLFRLAGLRSVGLATDGRRWLLHAAVEVPPECHEVERFFHVALGALRSWDKTPAMSTASPRLGLVLAERHRADADRLLQQHGIGTPYALLAPIATGLHRGKVKQWPHFDALARELTLRGLTVVACPTAREAQATQAAVPNARLLPPVDLGVYAALAERAQLVVANDSGISHLAAAVGARQLTLVGVTDQRRTGPWSPRAVVAGELGRWPTVVEAVQAAEQALQR